MSETHPIQQTPIRDMQFDAQLAESLGFDREDLIANRNGQMTDQQIDRKLQAFSQSRTTDTALMMVALFAGLLIAVMMANNGGFWVLVGIVVAILVILFVVIGILSANTKKQELEAGIVKPVMGVVEVTYVRNGIIITMGDDVYNGDLGMMHHRYTKASQAFENEKSYILYVLPESNVIISAEPYEYPL